MSAAAEPIRDRSGAAAEKPDVHTTAGKLADLYRRIEDAVHAGSAQAVERQHAKGRQTARERIDQLLDPGSFVELDALTRHRSTNFDMEARRPLGDGVVTGTGTIDGRPVAVFSQDATVFGGALGEVYGEKIVKVMDLAVKIGCPVVGINDGGGARIQEGVVALGLYGEIFIRNVRSSGVVPQISLIMGACAGGAVYSPAITDFTIMVDRTSHMFITGPDIIKTVTGEDVDFEELGGGRAHNTKSGVAHYLASDETDALDYVKELLSYLPSNNLSEPPSFPAPEPTEGAIADDLTDTDLELDSLIPDSANTPYDMHEVITRVLDEGEFLEVQGLFAPNIITGYGRIEGRSVGVVANQPTQFAGCLDIDASEKAARFVRTCDAFNIPILTFVDVPGFLPGTEQEWNGIIRRGAKLIYAYAEATVGKVTVITRKAYGGAYDVMGSKHLGADVNVAWPTAQIAVTGAAGAVSILRRGAKLIYAYAEATVPKVTVITRKAYGGAYDVMGSKHLGADINVAWPTAQIAVTGAAGAVSILYRKELAALSGDELAARRAELQQEYEDTLANPYLAADRGYIDGVIPPSHTRGYVGRALRLLANKREAVPPRKHGNIPL